MADKQISELPSASYIDANTQIPVYVPSNAQPAQKASGKLFEDFAKSSVSEYVETARASATSAAQSANAATTAEEQAVNSANIAAQHAASAEQYSGNPPIIQNGNWWTWNATTGEYVDTGDRAVLGFDKVYPSYAAMEADKGNCTAMTTAIIASDVADPYNSRLYIHDGTDWVFLSDLSGYEGVGISGITLTSGDHSPGSTDIYTITLTDGSTYTISVYTGKDGSGSGDMTSSVYDPAGGKKQVAFASDLTAHTGNNTIHVTAAEKESWSGKQDALTFDSAPTSGSTNPVTSGGVNTALSAKANASALNSHTGNSNIHVTAEEKATWNESDVFVATYNSTTFDEVEAAYNAGKAVLCKSTNTYYFLSIALVGTSYTFQCVTYSTVDDDDGNTFYLNSAKFLQVKKSGGWSSFTSNYPKKHAAAHAMGGIDEITPVADTNYTTLKLRGQSLNSVDTTPTLNGKSAWTYG